jgi:HSP20 family molecular chaperone IbpA
MSEKSAAVQSARAPTAPKVVEPGSLFERIDRVYDSIARRAFELFETNGCNCGRELDDWFKAESEFLHAVHVHIEETEKSYSVRAEVPGFSAKELEVSVEPGRVVISGKRETKGEERKGQTIYCDCTSNELLRIVELPGEVNTSGVVANLNNGVLKLELPKVPKKLPLRIEPKAA